jgi:hypothetical protein
LVRSAKIGDKPDIAWIQSAVRNPNACVWLSINRCKHASTPGQWKKLAKHIVVVVGYGTRGDGVVDPNALTIHNPDRQRLLPRPTRDSVLTDDSVSLTPIIYDNGDGQACKPLSPNPGYFYISGPGLPHTARSDADFVDGALVMLIAKRAPSFSATH